MVPAFEKAVALAPDDPVPLVELARALVGRARSADAIEALDKARLLGAEPVELAALRGEALLRAGRVGEAKDELADVERRASGARKLVAQTNLARAMGDFAGAREAGVRAVRAAPDDPEARLALANALLEGEGPEPDAATAQASAAHAIGGRADAAALELILVSSTVAGFLLPRPTDDVVDAVKRLLERGERDLDAMAPAARFHARLGAALLRLPSEAARAIGKAELETARRLEPAAPGR